jgi:hypothetical protein
MRSKHRKKRTHPKPTHPITINMHYTTHLTVTMYLRSHQPPPQSAGPSAQPPIPFLFRFIVHQSGKKKKSRLSSRFYNIQTAAPSAAITPITLPPTFPAAEPSGSSSVGGGVETVSFFFPPLELPVPVVKGAVEVPVAVGAELVVVEPDGRLVSMSIWTALQIWAAKLTVASRSFSVVQPLSTQPRMSSMKALLEQMHLGSIPQSVPMRSLPAQSLAQDGRLSKLWAATRAAPATRRTEENFIVKCG